MYSHGAVVIFNHKNVYRGEIIHDMFWRHDDTYTHRGYNPCKAFPWVFPCNGTDTLYSVTLLVKNHTCVYLHSIRILTALKKVSVCLEVKMRSHCIRNWVQLVLIVRIGCFLYDVHTHTHRKYYAKLS